MTETGDATWLDDLFVVDLGDEATAWAGGLLAELGASVVRIEARDGDRLRSDESRFIQLTANAGKTSLAVDFANPKSWQPVIDAASSIDVAIGPLAPDHPARALFEQLAAAGVPVVDSAFRRAARAEIATDLIIEAASGQMVLNGGPDDPPAHPAGDLGFKQTGLAVAHAALSVAIARRRTGHAGRVDVSAQEASCLTTIQTANGNYWHWHKRAPGRHPKLTEGTTVLSADGKWTSFTIHGPNWPRYVEWVGGVLGPQGIEGPEWNDSEHAVTNRHMVAEITARMAAALTQAELLEQGQARGLLLLPVQDLGDIAADGHLLARDFYETVETTDGEQFILPGSPFRSNRGRARRGAAPVLGGGGAEALASARPVPVGDETVDPRQPLAGIRIVDFCWAIAGPLTTRLLAGLGAEVLKIESENGLDTIRYIGVQPKGSASWDTNGVFQDTSPNKRAVTINVNTAEGRDVVRDLISTADVVTANYTPDRMDRWGLGAADLEQIKPDLITVNMAVMGTHGPNKGWRSYGSGIVAMCGLAAHTGRPERLPECLGTLHTDFTVPYYAALQIMSALHHRSRTGEGVHIELAQYETAVRLLDAELTAVLNGEQVPERAGNRSTTMAPHGAFPSAGDDQWVAIACRHDADWHTLVGLVPDLAALDRWNELDEVEQCLQAWTRERSKWDVSALLQAAGIPSSPVEDLADLFGPDPSMPEAWTEVELAGGVTGVALNEPMVWDGERLPLQRSPQWFEHTYEILVEERGMTAETFADLVERQVLW
ncbi:MAG: benzylsuccinate CoA-transferase BbsF subunit [Acidimicrobiales bacterium]|jgi:benzylsuccinate CoA-transferase BbsF subunit